MKNWNWGKIIVAHVVSILLSGVVWLSAPSLTIYAVIIVYAGVCVVVLTLYEKI